MSDGSKGEAVGAVRGNAAKSGETGCGGPGGQSADETGDINLVNVGLSHSMAAGMLSVQAAHAMGLNMLTAQALQQNDGVLANAIVAGICTKLLSGVSPAQVGVQKEQKDPLADVLRTARSNIKISLGRLETATGPGGVAAIARELLDSIETQTNQVRSALDAATTSGSASAAMQAERSGKAGANGTASKKHAGRRQPEKSAAKGTATQEAS